MYVCLVGFCLVAWQTLGGQRRTADGSRGILIIYNIHAWEFVKVTAFPPVS